MNALDGIKVLDFSVGNPFPGSMFAEYGATVVKIEDKNKPDSVRTRGKQVGGSSIYQAYYDREKKSISVNLDTEGGRELVRKMLKNFDMVCTNRRVDELKEMGLYYDQIKDECPGLIYGLLTPFGLKGEWKDYPDYDLIICSRTGLQEKTGFEDKPTRIGFPISYFYGSWHLTGGMLAAYYRSLTTKKGCMVDVSSWHATMHTDDTYAQCFFGDNELPRRLGNGLPGPQPTEGFECKNGWFEISIASDNQWQAFARAAGKDIWAEDSRYATDPSRSADNYYGDLDQQLIEFFAGITIEEADRICQEAKVPGGPCNTVPDMLVSEQVKCRNMLIDVVDPRIGIHKQLGRPAKFSFSDDTEKISPAPYLGQDNGYVLKNLVKLSDEEIRNLFANEII